jgi:hypothetical protein
MPLRPWSFCFNSNSWRLRAELARRQADDSGLKKGAG